MEGKGKLIRINGKRVFYAQYGSKGKAMLLLHGWSGSHENFNRWLPVFEGKYRVIIPDLPGCGMSEPLDKRHTLESYADFLEEFVRVLKLKKFILGGLCGGAALALEFVAGNRNKVSTLLLHTPPFAPYVVTRLFKTQARLGRLPGIYQVVRRARKNPRITLLYKKVLIEGFNVNREDELINMKNLRDSHYAASMEFVFDLLNHDYTYLLSTIDVPIYVIVAEKDKLVKVREIQRIPRIARNAIVKVIGGEGHGWSDALIRKQNRILSELF